MQFLFQEEFVPVGQRHQRQPVDLLDHAHQRQRIFYRHGVAFNEVQSEETVVPAVDGTGLFESAGSCT